MNDASKFRQKDRIYLSSPTMHSEEKEYIDLAFNTNWVAPLGENVDNFEEDIVKYTGTRAAVALSAGTAALHLAVKLCNIRQNDIVFCSDLTFSATVNPVSYEKGVQVFIDSERESWNMDPKALEKAFEKYNGKNKPLPKAVIVANLYGVPAKLNEIKSICDKFCVPLIEDAAESLSATYMGRQTGTYGKYGIYSFNGNKIITTSGGGMLISDEEKDIIKAKFWSTQSRDPFPYYQHSELGYNYRMSNVVAGIGRGQMCHIDEHKKLKQNIYKRYKEGFDGYPVSMNPFIKCSDPNFWLSCIKLDKRSSVTPIEIINQLEKYNIESRHIWKPMHMQPYYQNHDFIFVEKTPVSEEVFETGICLPSDIKMDISQQNNIINIIQSILE